MSDIARRAMQDMPAWLKPSMDTSLPVDWHPLMIAFLWLTKHVLDAEKPETFLACFDHVAGETQIGFGARPPLPPHLTNALRLIAEKIEGLASLKHTWTSNSGSMSNVDEESTACVATDDEPSISNTYEDEASVARRNHGRQKLFGHGGNRVRCGQRSIAPECERIRTAHRLRRFSGHGGNSLQCRHVNPDFRPRRKRRQRDFAFGRAIRDDFPTCQLRGSVKPWVLAVRRIHQRG